ncbi:hypothetical protein MRX96_039722 [Rhipicephalus microplus]
MRIDNANTTEDCLHLNIWAPIQQHPTEPKKAVMVYFYGGSFTHGGNSYFFYDGRYISSIGDVVLVVPNYRLGALGFLNAGTPDAPGNVALHDQILALSWVKDNIAAFGGRPESSRPLWPKCRCDLRELSADIAPYSPLVQASHPAEWLGFGATSRE